MKTAILLIAHGSRQAEANDDLFGLVQDLRARGPYAVVEAAFLELAEPTIAMAGRRCAAAGAERVILLPYFLSAGVHVRRDLQQHRDELAQEFPMLEVMLGQPLGPHALLREIVLQRAREAEVKP